MTLNRRKLFVGAGASLAAAAGLTRFAGVARAAVAPADMTLAQAMYSLGTGAISAEEYVRALLAQMDACVELNAFISTDRRAILETAGNLDRGSGLARFGMLAGIPLAVKDNIDTRDLPTTAGTPALKYHRPRSNAQVVQVLLDAGALLAGKANLHELAMGVTNNNVAFGAARNPFDPAMIPGGSSGGTAVAVASRMVPAGLGTDTGGSCRVPASLCGVVGYRPTSGRYSLQGVLVISHTVDTIGILARSVEDVAILDSLIAGAPLQFSVPSLRGVRLGIPRKPFYEDLDSESARTCESGLRALERSGAILVDVDLSAIAEVGMAAAVVPRYEGVRNLPNYLAEHELDLSVEELVGQIASPDVARNLNSRVDGGGVPSAEMYEHALSVSRVQLRRTFNRAFVDHRVTALVYPTTPLPARPIGQDETVELNGKQVPTFMGYARNTAPVSMAGLPALSVPVGLTGAGLPVGLEFNAREGADWLLLQVGQAVEQVFGQLPPPPDCS